MPLETATYISQLNSANPAHSDQLNAADSHMRLLKATIQATFPNFTAVALSATQAQLDAAVSATTNGAAVLADAGAHFKTNTTDGIYNPSAGEVDIKTAGVVRAQFTSAGITTPGILAGASITGAGSVPVGSITAYAGSAAPTNWLICNGASLLRSSYPDLFTAIGTTFGAADGTHFSIPDITGRSIAGKEASATRLTSGAGGVDGATLGAVGGEQAHTLTSAEMPSHTHTATSTSTDAGHTHTVSALTQASQIAAGGGPFSGNTASITTSTGFASITTTTTNTNTGGGGAHANVQPTIVLNYIIRAL